MAAYRATWACTYATVAAAPIDAALYVGDEAPVNLRWVLMHLLQEHRPALRARGHPGELVDGDTGRRRTQRFTSTRVVARRGEATRRRLVGAVADVSGSR